MEVGLGVFQKLWWIWETKINWFILLNKLEDIVVIWELSFSNRVGKRHRPWNGWTSSTTTELAHRACIPFPHTLPLTDWQREKAGGREEQQWPLLLVKRKQNKTLVYKKNPWILCQGRAYFGVNVVTTKMSLLWIAVKVICLSTPTACSPRIHPAKNSAATLPSCSTQTCQSFSSGEKPSWRKAYPRQKSLCQWLLLTT